MDDIHLEELLRRLPGVVLCVSKPGAFEVELGRRPGGGLGSPTEQVGKTFEILEA
jgi:hypothetical protein